MDELIGCAGMGTVNVNALEVTAGNIFFIASEAAVDLSRPPFKQSSNVNNDCRTGLEYETCNGMSKILKSRLGSKGSFQKCVQMISII